MADITVVLASVAAPIRRRETKQRVPRHFLDRQNPLEKFSPAKVRRKYRLHPHQILDLTDILAPDIEPETQRSQAIPALIKVCAFLRFITTGTFYDSVGELLGISEASMLWAVRAVAHAIKHRMLRDYIRWPNAAAVNTVKAAFAALAGTSENINISFVNTGSSLRTLCHFYPNAWVGVLTKAHLTKGLYKYMITLF